MTASRRAPGLVLRWRRLAASGLGAAALTLSMSMGAAGLQPGSSVQIDIRFSHFNPALVSVPFGQPIRFVIHNADPIDHEWVLGDADVHAFHRISTIPVHEGKATEMMIPAGTTRTTTVTFDKPGQLEFICHLPAHEAFGMVGWVTIGG
jgi:uncharacterized cupredoxin-like copper-binding protein